MIFNGTKKTLDFRFLFKGEEVEITSTYTYLGVQFSGPRLSLQPTLQPQINKGYESLALLERQCFIHHFQNISSKMDLLNTLICPIVLYGSEVWGPSLFESDLASAERVQILLLWRIIRCKQIVPQHIILAKFGAQPFRLETVFILVSFIHQIRGLADSSKGWDRYPYLSYCSAQIIASAIHQGRAKCWFTGVSSLLALVGI